MAIFLPIMQFYLMCLTIGRPLTGIKVGIFNGEKIGCKLNNFTYDCQSMGLSCLLISEISDDIFKKIFFTDFDDAFVEAKVGNIMMEISSNFSMELTKSPRLKGNLENDLIKIYSDQTNIYQFQFAKFEFFRAYDDFIQNIAAKCNRSLRHHRNQMEFTNEKGDKFEKSIDYQLTMIPTLYLV